MELLYKKLFRLGEFTIGVSNLEDFDLGDFDQIPIIRASQGRDFLNKIPGEQFQRGKKQVQLSNSLQPKNVWTLQCMWRLQCH